MTKSDPPALTLCHTPTISACLGVHVLMHTSVYVHYSCDEAGTSADHARSCSASLLDAIMASGHLDRRLLFSRHAEMISMKEDFS